MDEGLMMMQELEDRLKEQIDKLEHIRLAASELKESLSGVRGFTKNPEVEKRVNFTALCSESFDSFDSAHL